jgi:hypothetical protein
LGVDLVEPLLHVVERLLRINRVVQNDSVGAAVKDLSHGSKIFLARGVPNHQLQTFIFNFNEIRVELNTNSDLPLHKLILHEPLDSR